MAITLDSANNGAASSVNVASITWTHTVGAGYGTILLVEVATGSAVSSVTYAGATMSLLATSNNLRLFYLLLPATGTNSIVVTISPTGKIDGCSTSYFGVDSFGTPITNTGSGTALTNTLVTTSTNQEVIDLVESETSSTFTPTAGQTREASQNGASTRSQAFGDIPASGGSMVLTWTVSTTGTWNQISVAMNPASIIKPRYVPRGIGSTIIPDPVSQPLPYIERGILSTIVYEKRIFVPRALGGVYIPDDPANLWVPRAFGSTTQIPAAVALTSTIAGAGTLTGTLSLTTALTSTIAGVGTLSGTLSANLALGITISGKGQVYGVIPTTFYISGSVGSSGNGRSWATAWKTFTDIVWANVHPGDTIEVDGGASGITYTTEMTVGTDGIAPWPITVKASTASGHNGGVTQWGGRLDQLPYSGHPAATWTETATVSTLINFGAHSCIIVDGSQWNGWHIYGSKYDAVAMDTTSSNNTMRHMEINDCGSAIIDGPTNTYYTDRCGIRPQGSYHLVEYCNIHDNGQDALQSGETPPHLTVRWCWLHFARENPDYPGRAFNCQRLDTGVGQHQDGFQTFGTTNTNDSVTFTDVLFGPGLVQGVITQGVVLNYTVQQCLFLSTPDGIHLYTPNSGSNNYLVDHCTFFQVPATATGELLFYGSNNTVTNCIVMGGRVEFDQAITASGNVQYQCYSQSYMTSLTQLDGTTTNPLFVTDYTTFNSPPLFSQLEAADFTPTAGAAIGVGATDFTSVRSFLKLVGGATGSAVSQPLPYIGRALGSTIIYENRTFIPRALGSTYIPDTILPVPRALLSTIQATVGLGCTLAGVGTLTGTLSANLTLPAVTIPGIGTLTGTLSTTGGVSLSVTMVGVGTLSGTMQLATALSTTLVGVGTLTGTLTEKTALSVTMAGVGTLAPTLSANLTLPGETMVGVGTLAGTMTLSTVLTSTIVGIGTISGVYSLRVALFLTCAGIGTISGTVTIPILTHITIVWMTRDLKATWITRDMKTTWTTRG